MDPLRLLVVSDVHSNLTALERVLEDAGRFDAAICAGDTVGYGPDPGDCLERLKGLEVRSVSGNHDVGVTTGERTISHFNVHAAAAVNINRSLLNQAQLRWLERLPKGLDLDIEGIKVSVFHGSPDRPIWEYVFPSEAELRAGEFFEATGADLLILGHTHVPFVHRLDGRVLMNPGSVGQPRDGDPRASYMLVDVAGGGIEVTYRRVEYDIESVASRITRLGIPEILAVRLFSGW
ncbi:MAG: metallophosphatase family protein [Candidatus Bathyarchaeota archaeon]|nr:metallophosphatase family protein [Candidatus Bathyarchaeota archaeon]